MTGTLAKIPIQAVNQTAMEMQGILSHCYEVQQCRSSLNETMGLIEWNLQECFYPTYMAQAPPMRYKSH